MAKSSGRILSGATTMARMAAMLAARFRSPIAMNTCTNKGRATCISTDTVWRGAVLSRSAATTNTAAASSAKIHPSCVEAHSPSCQRRLLELALAELDHGQSQHQRDVACRDKNAQPHGLRVGRQAVHRPGTPVKARKIGQYPLDGIDVRSKFHQGRITVGAPPEVLGDCPEALAADGKRQAERQGQHRHGGQGRRSTGRMHPPRPHRSAARPR